MFVVAVNRDRDRYQVPLALAEADVLGALVTDYYVDATRVPVPTLGHRRVDGIEGTQATISWRALARQMPYEVLRRVRPVDFPSAAVEGALGRTAAKQAARNPEQDLLLYSGSARAAFEGPSTGLRAMFQYHPSPDFIERSLDGVDDLADLRPWADEAEPGNAKMLATHRAECDLADLILCASSYTRRGLLEAGVDESRIRVVPYGCPVPQEVPDPAKADRVEFLFVGQGVRRKGLHLLVEAWRRAALADAHLTIVASRRLDPEIKGFAEDIPGLKIKGALSREDLMSTMQRADTFVLPSLVEGFGLVLGEALGNGARIIASDHTGLPDLDLGPELSTVVPAGDVDALAAALTTSVSSAHPQRPYQKAAIAAARVRGWDTFRRGVREAVGVSEPGPHSEL